jgi:hypothetical protein
MVMVVMIWNWCKEEGGPGPGLEGWPKGCSREVVEEMESRLVVQENFLH